MSPYRNFLDAGDRISDIGTVTSFGIGGITLGLEALAQYVPGAPHSLPNIGVVPLAILTGLTMWRIYWGSFDQREKHRHEEEMRREENEQRKEENRAKEALINLENESKIARAAELNALVNARANNVDAVELNKMSHKLDSGDDIRTGEMERLPE